MKKIENFNVNSIKALEILFASTSDPEYEMDRVILLDRGIKVDEVWHEYILIDGGHCSCFGFEEVEWTVIAYTREELKRLAEPKNACANQADQSLHTFINRYCA